ncbi:MAG: TOBE domain-containing protein [Methylomonas sp.]
MSNSSDNNPSARWVNAELRLVGIDKRIISLLKAIAANGSINQAAKQIGLSYKGAWLILERANNLSPQALITTAIGGSKGGGSSLTPVGMALLNLFSEIETKHQAFLDGINRDLIDNADLLMLLNRMEIKTSAENQLSAKITAITPGTVNAQLVATLKGGTRIVLTESQAVLDEFNLQVGDDVLLLINGSDITLLTDMDQCAVSTPNLLPGKVVRIQTDNINAEVIMRLECGETLLTHITYESAVNLGLEPGIHAYAAFNGGAAVLCVAANNPLDS